MRDRKGDDSRALPSEAAERYAQLPRCTREWLETRRPDDWSEIDDALKFLRSVRTNGRFLVWAFAGIFGMFVAAATMGDQVIRIIAWFKR